MTQVMYENDERKLLNNVFSSFLSTNQYRKCNFTIEQIIANAKIISEPQWYRSFDTGWG